MTTRPAAEPSLEEAADQLRRAVSRQFGRSLHIRTLDSGSCAACEQEIRLLAAPHYDLHRLGFFFTPAPRHADLLMVTGPMIRACALGGVYQPDAFTRGGVEGTLPVDVWIPGCPPSPLALLQGLLVAVGRLGEKVRELTFISQNGSPR